MKMQCPLWIYRLYSNKIKRYNQWHWIHVIINFPKEVMRNCIWQSLRRDMSIHASAGLLSQGSIKIFDICFLWKNTHNRFSSWNPKCLHCHFAQFLSNIKIYFFYHSLFGTKTYTNKASTLKFTVLKSELAAIFQLVSMVSSKFIFNITFTLFLGFSPDLEDQPWNLKSHTNHI